MKLWRYDPITGYWKHERTISILADAQKWLKLFQLDSPGAHFKLSTQKPRSDPTRNKRNPKMPEIHIDIGSHNARRSRGAKTNPKRITKSEVNRAGTDFCECRATMGRIQHGYTTRRSELLGTARKVDRTKRESKSARDSGHDRPIAQIIMPLLNGYGQKTVNANIAALMIEGYPLKVARAISLANARVSYFHAKPRGVLPLRLAYPKHLRSRDDYNLEGRAYREFNAPQENPKRAAPRAAELAKARRLFAAFTGRAPQGVKQLKIRPFDTGLAIGKVLGIIYSVEATGEKFRHTFKASSRPHLVISADGHQVIVCGGNFTFTERGFVDK